MIPVKGSTNANLFGFDSQLTGFVRPSENRRVIDVREGYQDEKDVVFKAIYKQSGGNETIGFHGHGRSYLPQIYAIYSNQGTGLIRIIYECETLPSWDYPEANPIIDSNTQYEEKKRLNYPRLELLKIWETDTLAASVPGWATGTKYEGQSVQFIYRSLVSHMQRRKIPKRTVGQEPLRFRSSVKTIYKAEDIPTGSIPTYNLYANIFMTAQSMILKNHITEMAAPLLLDGTYCRIDADNGQFYKP